MQVEKNKVVSMHYTLKSAQGDVIDSSIGSQPLVYIQGIGNIIPGLEKQLEGKSAGEKVLAIVLPEDAYGVVRNELIQVVPKSGFEGDDELTEGIQVEVETGKGRMIARVTKIDGNDVTLDMNHPLAGETLYFDVEITHVRAASADELDHGHVHGPGGHHH